MSSVLFIFLNLIDFHAKVSTFLSVSELNENQTAAYVNKKRFVGKEQKPILYK